MLKLKLEERNLNHKTHELRSEGVIPGVLYGKGIESEAIQMKDLALTKKLDSNGEIYKISTKEGDKFVKFDEVQIDPVTHEHIHFSLVTLEKGVKTEVDIPVEFINTASGIKEGGTVVHIQESIKVYGVPSKMPKVIKADLTTLNIGDKLTIEDVKMPKSVEVHEELDNVLAVCTPPRVESLEADTNEIEPEVIGEEKVS